MTDPRGVYDPIGDITRVLGAALRAGAHSSVVNGALARLREGLALDDHPFESEIEDQLRAQLAMTRPGRRAEALANVRYLAALPDDLLREAVRVFQHEQPGKADLLWGYLTGAVTGPQEPDVHLGRGDEIGPQSACT